MRFRMFLVLTVACALFADLLGPAPAFAYLDGGTGSLIFQWIIAGAVAGAFGFRMLWARFFGKLGRKSADIADEPEDA